MAAAPVPPPPWKVSVGVPVKFDPPFTTVTDATLPGFRIAKPIAPVPPPLGKDTIGAPV